jgi:hypothetical protein
MRNDQRDPEAPRSARSERGSADSRVSRDMRNSESGRGTRHRRDGGVCCDEQMIGAERFPRKGDGEDEYDE